METLYRIESINDGLGYFKSRDNQKVSLVIDDRICSRHGNYNIFPPTFLDSELCRKSKYINDYEYRHGYLNLDTLKKGFKWIELKHIYKHGFRLYEIKVKKCIKSSFQAVFHPDHIIEKIEITI